MAYREDCRYLFRSSRLFCYHYFARDRTGRSDSGYAKVKTVNHRRQSLKARRLTGSGNAIKPPEFAMRWSRCDDRARSNRQLVFIEFRAAFMAQQRRWDAVV